MLGIRHLNRIAFQSLLVLLTLSFNAAAQQVVPLKGTDTPSEMVRLDTRPGVTVTFQVVMPKVAPLAAVILFAGGSGKLGLAHKNGRAKMKSGKSNFAIRTGKHLLKENIIAVRLDAPSDRQDKDGMGGGFRNGTDHAKDIAAVVYYLKKTYDVPIWLHGTSRGSESVANAASRTIPGLSGIILSSSVTKNNKTGESILQRPLDRINIPALVLAHKGDGCHVTPPEGAQQIANAMAASPKVAVKLFDGGKNPKSGPCGARSEHGFFGIEKKVLKTIAKFIKENS